MDYNKGRQESGIFSVGSLYSYLQRLEDPRSRQGKRYGLASILLLMILAKMGGEQNASGITDWIAYRRETLQQHIPELAERCPCHMTYRRVLQTIVDAEELEHLMSSFHQQRLEEENEVVLTMDGKTIRGTIPKGETRGTHLLSLYAPDTGLVLAEAEVDHKENEIVVAPQLLEQLQIKGKIVLGDAMHTQRAISSQIVSEEANYVWIAKGNQARLRWAIERIFYPQMARLKSGLPLQADFSSACQVSKGHGRLEKRTLYSTTLLNEYLDWPHVAQVFRLERLVYHDPDLQRATLHIVYGLTSLAPHRATPHCLLSLVRQYWKIENSLHYRRDVTFHEDHTRLTLGNAGHNMAILNNFIIGLFSSAGFTNHARAQRLFSANPVSALHLIFGEC
jgi:predicted transposase YbfD/YdcC